MADKMGSILIIDDEQPILRLLSAVLGKQYLCVGCTSADEGLEALSRSRFNLVLTDIVMPGTSGLELCQLIQKMCPETVTIVMSGMMDIQYAVQAMRQGAFDYITKPLDISQVGLSIDRALRYQALLGIRQRYEESLEEAIAIKTKELRMMNESLNGVLEALYSNYRATLKALASALEARDVESPGHSDRVVAYTLKLAKELGLGVNSLIALEQGALLHDIGKIGVRESVLLKKGDLTPDEWNEMAQHVSHGMKIIDGIDFLSGARPIVSQHHERFDGTGYPGRIRGENIHLHARIFAVADAFDAITSDRPYRSARSYAEARTEIQASTGTHFDRTVAEAFMAVPEREWVLIREAAESHSYVEKMIDLYEIRSFVISLKQSTGSTGQLRLPTGALRQIVEMSRPA